MKRNMIVLLIFSFFTCQTSFAQFAQADYDPKKVAQDGLTEIQFVGTGDIQLALAEGKDIAASTGLGAIFWRIWPNEQFEFEDFNSAMSGMELQLEIKVNVASTTDTISALFNNNILMNRRVFGSYILAPVSSGPATTINSIWYIKPSKYNTETGVTSRRLFNGKKFKGIPFIDGVELGAIAANQIWLYDGFQAKNVSMIGWRAGIFHEFLPDPVRRQEGYSIRLGANYIGRSIQGDMGRDSDTLNDLLLNQETTYHGLEFALTLRLRNIRAEASLPIMHIGATNPVPGLSGTQFLTAISFVGGFPLSIK